MTKQAIIVGGTTGMGRSTAELLLKDGNEVIIIGRPDKQLDQTIKELSKLGSVKGVELDLSDFEKVTGFSKTISSLYPNLKYLVNAAGYFSPKPFLEHQEEDYEVYHNFNKAFFFIN